MTQILDFVVRHGAAVLLAAVFVEQLGVPLPADSEPMTGGGMVADWYWRT